MGRTLTQRIVWLVLSDHPHVRGENFLHVFLQDTNHGPSPRAWGEQFPHRKLSYSERTIPTCVGRTVALLAAMYLFSDHPHVRGENCWKWLSRVISVGPSPRAWGERDHQMSQLFSKRTIPTCVGRTLATQRQQQQQTDHPHVRGENLYSMVNATGDTGPSPRAWGERDQSRSQHDCCRTIPTCVGRTS